MIVILFFSPPFLGVGPMSENKSKKTRKFPKAGTIGHIVLNALAAKPDLKTEDILPEVMAKFPESKFNTAHLAWYKHQVKVGNYDLSGITGTAPKKAPKTKKPHKAAKES